MKKLLLLLTLLIGAVSLTGCQKEKYYTNYSTGATNWIGGTEKMYAEAALYLINNGYVSQFQLDGGSTLEEHNSKAITIFDGTIQQLKTSGLDQIAAKLKGMEGAPCTISFDYMIMQATELTWVPLKIENLSVEIKK